MNFHEANSSVHICVRYSGFYRLEPSQKYSCFCRVTMEGPELNLMEYTKLKLSWMYRFEYDNVKQFQIISESAFVIHGNKILPAENKILQVVHKSIDKLTTDVNEKRFLNTSMKPLDKISDFEVWQTVEEIKERLGEWFELQ